MLNFLTKIFDENAKTMQRYQGIVEKINAFEPELKNLSDAKLGAKTAAFKKQLEGGKTLDEILPEAFAVVRETSRRTIGLRHYDVQLMAGIAFHEG
ncbi:MAG TPA: preprotein translocase subunit SecA, partial [Candidatus Saccharimonadia bacterium]|nr:preprotein translocase subunit SecA [Candidatus Saccharimonadia bacterium]